MDSSGFQPVVRLRCAVQNYAWGKVGSSSQVAQLAASGESTFSIDESQPYSELWMGTHPKGPSEVVDEHVPAASSLAAWVEKFGERVLGSKVYEKFNHQLPFLFKVLSIRKALSIQAHPEKSHAEQLHAQRPDKYPDPNHKPEMALALTPFEGMCGFRPANEIAGFFQNIPELRQVISEQHCSSFCAAVQSAGPDANSAKSVQEGLKQCFHTLMHCQEEQVQASLEQLCTRLQESLKSDELEQSQLASLILRVSEQFPGDVGCFVIYFLNIVHLAPGQAMFLGPNIPHAYLSGDCVECMACSDNVVRAGLTPKYKDKETLLSMLDYTMAPAETRIFPSHPGATAGTNIYDPPVPDFSVSSTRVLQSTEQSLDQIEGASILLVTEGNGQVTVKDTEKTFVVGRGTVLFAAAGAQLLVKTNSAGELLLFRAYCSL